jgi:hypothetical protein
MSALPPISPRPLAPAPANASAVRDARAMFFKALGEVPQAAPSAPVARLAFTAPTTPAPPVATAPTPSAEDLNRPRRPGSLLDIRV